GTPSPPDKRSNANRRARRQSRWGCGPRHTATTGAGPTSTHSGPGAILPTCGLAQPLEYLLSSLSAQQDLDDCAIGLATIDLSASAPLCQSPVFRFSAGSAAFSVRALGSRWGAQEVG